MISSVLLYWDHRGGRLKKELCPWVVSENYFNKMVRERRESSGGCLADTVKFQAASMN